MGGNWGMQTAHLQCAVMVWVFTAYADKQEGNN